MIPLDTDTKALSYVGITFLIDVTGQNSIFFSFRSASTSFLTRSWQQIRRKISEEDGRFERKCAKKTAVIG